MNWKRLFRSIVYAAGTAALVTSLILFPAFSIWMLQELNVAEQLATQIVVVVTFIIAIAGVAFIFYKTGP